MSEKQFLTFLGDFLEDRIRCVFETRQGKVSGIKIVQYETLWHGRWVPVVRYDTAHGFFHRDVYIRGGKKHLKELVPTKSLEESLTHAIEDIQRNWSQYKLAFLEQKNEKT